MKPRQRWSCHVDGFPEAPGSMIFQGTSLGAHKFRPDLGAHLIDFNIFARRAGSGEVALFGKRSTSKQPSTTAK